MPDFSVLITGAGLGGLTLAQSLHRAGIPVQVFERDRSLFDRMQGYRLHLDVDALSAVHEVLPPDLLEVFHATAFITEPFTTILDTDLTVRKRFLTADEHDVGVWPAYEGPPEHANVDRATLRQILFAGLDDCVHFGRTLDHYETDVDSVTVHFTDGTSTTGSVLVGADGIHSAVRRLRAPRARLMDAGITALYGRVPFAATAAIMPPETLNDIFTIASDARKVFLGAGAVRFPMPPRQAAEHYAPGMVMEARDDYAVCIVGGRHEFFPTGLDGLTSPELQCTATGIIAGWPERARSFVQAADPESFFLIRMSTSIPCLLDASGNVTLLGDAIHAMTPSLGRGANVAMRDAALLARALRAVAAGEIALADALSGYEQQMLAYGFGVVREAARMGWQRMGQTPLPDGG